MVDQHADYEKCIEHPYQCNDAQYYFRYSDRGGKDRIRDKDRDHDKDRSRDKERVTTIGTGRKSSSSSLYLQLAVQWLISK